jgi:hypothetical protein
MQNVVEKLPAWLLMLAGFIMVALLGCIDYLTGDYSMLIFYAVPVAFEAWFLGRWGALLICAAAGSARFASDYISYSGTSIRYWNSLQDMVFLLVVGLLIARVKKLLSDDQEKLER